MRKRCPQKADPNYLPAAKANIMLQVFDLVAGPTTSHGRSAMVHGPDVAIPRVQAKHSLHRQNRLLMVLLMVGNPKP